MSLTVVLKYKRVLEPMKINTDFNLRTQIKEQVRILT